MSIQTYFFATKHLHHTVHKAFDKRRRQTHPKPRKQWLPCPSKSEVGAAIVFHRSVTTELTWRVQTCAPETEGTATSYEKPRQGSAEFLRQLEGGSFLVTLVIGSHCKQNTISVRTPEAETRIQRICICTSCRFKSNCIQLYDPTEAIEQCPKCVVTALVFFVFLPSPAKLITNGECAAISRF